MNLDELKILLSQKEKKVDTDIDREKIANLKFLLSQEDIFFKLETETAIGILDFLGVEHDKIYDCYLSLISAERFQQINFGLKK